MAFYVLTGIVRARGHLTLTLKPADGADTDNPERLLLTEKSYEKLGAPTKGTILPEERVDEFRLAHRRYEAVRRATSILAASDNSEAMLYMAFVAIATYAQTSFEIGYALKFMRLLLLILTQLFGLWGYIAGILITVCAVAFNKTLSGRNYLYPLIPWDGRQLVKRLFRVSLQWSEKNKYSKR